MTLASRLEAGVADVPLATDPTAVEQILFNLVDNAAKYASRASNRAIEVAIGSRADRVWFRVVDHGPGIGPRELKRLFRPFEKSARDAAHSAPGVGLGLSLSRRVARQLGGELRHEAYDGHGAAFVLELPR
jgi:signal transduction histidine kinase